MRNHSMGMPAFFATALCLTSTLAVLTQLRVTNVTDVESVDDCAASASAARSAHALVTTDTGADGEGEGVDRPSLVGELLVASPSLDDPYFAGAVIYMLADDEAGAIGVVLNRARDHEEHQGVALWDGGPVGRERVFVLHDDHEAQGSVHVGSVAVASDPSLLEELFNGRGPKNARVFVGYAGWGPGQLDHEIAQGAWRTTRAPRDARALLSTDTAALTRGAYAQLARLD